MTEEKINDRGKSIDEIKKERLGTTGGQALIEGVMMTGPKGTAMAVRHVISHKIKVKKIENKRFRDSHKIGRVPFIRGIINFVESMILGYKTLMDSAELSGSMESDVPEEEMSKADKWIDEHFGPKMITVISIISSILGFAIAFFLFMYLPSKIVTLADNHLFSQVLAHHNLKPLFEGIIRIVIFVAYIALVGQMKDMKRVFQYHGAEHKTIFCYESGEELTVENVRKQKRFHPRCGTNFIFIVLLISILCSSLLAVIIRQFPWGMNFIENNAIGWVLVKILIIPIVVGISYEYIMYAGHHENIFTKIVSAPGLALQRITTKEPDDSMIECGIASMKAAVYNEYPDDETGEEDKCHDEKINAQE